ncbi:putative nuclease HARBI1 [Cololabis saira]|uniref:putative nuclease HARBI1 n=1 Tax=Cololabis saira TaxID=129043 RepID=UPI002AD55CBF|nr:putative nuclease HARBI1 [Cololabis saira]
MAFAVPVWLAVQQELSRHSEEDPAEPSCLEDFDDETLFQLFHLTRPCIAFIMDAIRIRMKTVTSRKPLPSVEAMVMVALNYYAHGVFTPVVLQKAGVNQSVSITSTTSTVSGVIAGMSDVFISFPLTVDARNRTAGKVEQFCGIPSVLGVVAPAHFKIRASPYERDSFKSFINALGYTSVVSQFICDSEGNILSVEKCCVGSTFEQDLWDLSFKGREVEEELHGPFWFIGGKGYSLTKHILTPVSQPNDSELSFNDAHAKIHNVMRQTLGSMKRRFKCLMQLGFAEEGSLNKKSNIIKACSVLHNIAKKFSVPPLPEDVNFEPLYPGKPHSTAAEINPEALQARKELIERNFSVLTSKQDLKDGDANKLSPTDSNTAQEDM